LDEQVRVIAALLPKDASLMLLDLLNNLLTPAESKNNTANHSNNANQSNNNNNNDSSDVVNSEPLLNSVNNCNESMIQSSDRIALPGCLAKFALKYVEEKNVSSKEILSAGMIH
jgi:hypothetical protein